RLMQLEKPKILRRGRIRRAAEKGCKCPDVPDILVVRLLDEVAHRHVFDHAPAQRADGFITHRGAPVLRWRLLDPLDSQDRTLGLSLSPAHLVTPSVPLAPLRAQRAPAKRVRSMTQSGHFGEAAMSEKCCQTRTLHRIWGFRLAKQRVRCLRSMSPIR